MALNHKAIGLCMFKINIFILSIYHLLIEVFRIFVCEIIGERISHNITKKISTFQFINTKEIKIVTNF